MRNSIAKANAVFVSVHGTDDAFHVRVTKREANKLISDSAGQLRMIYVKMPKGYDIVITDNR